MKRYVKPLSALFLLLVGCMLWSVGIVKYHELDKIYGGISLRFETNPQVIDSLVEIRNQQQAAGTDSNLTAWRQDYNIKIEDSCLGVCIESDVIYIWGDGKGILGTYKDVGCSMSADKSYELWGSRDVLGKTIYIDGVSYKVACVTDMMEGVIAVRKSDYERDMKFVSLDMEPISNQDERDVLIEEFVLQNSHSADSSINYYEMLFLTGNFMLFPVFTVAAYMFGRILTELYCAKKHKKGFKVIACYVFFLILWVSVCFFTGSFSFEIPGSFIPTKWSDFDFWSRVIERLKNELSGLRLMPMYALDNYFRKSFIYISICSFLSSACFIAVLRYIRNKNLNMLIVIETVTAFIMFYAAVSAGAQYGKYSGAYWFILPGYFVFDFFINNFKLRERT